jgi:hypothetical protein
VRTSTLVQATADVVTIVSLRRGDVYKRLEESQYGGGTQLHFGVVTDVMHNGTDAVITALEFPMDYSGAPTPKLKTFGTSADLRLFAAQPEEVRQHFGEVMDGSRRALNTAREAWEKANATDVQVRSLIEQIAGELTAPATGVPELEPAETADEDENADDKPEPF